MSFSSLTDSFIVKNHTWGRDLMLIAPKTVEKLADFKKRHGEKILKLTGAAENRDNILMMALSKNLLGSSGELITPSSFLKFKANGGLSKLKKLETVNCNEVNTLETTSSGSYSRWTFKTASDKFTVRFANYKGNRFTIQKEYIERGSRILWDVLGKTLGNLVPANHSSSLLRKRTH